MRSFFLSQFLLSAAVFAAAIFAAAILGSSLAPNVASAQLEACGDIHVEANAMCEILVEGGCTVMCEPLSFTASCAADLQVGCAGECNSTEITTCTENTVEACTTQCDLNPGMFSCRAECTANIGASCTANCAGMAGDGMARARCEASCESTYEAECSADCNVQLPSLTCAEKCEEIRVTRCRSEVNVDCQVDCQATGYVDCETNLTGGCMTACTEPDGALFCDGQYVDHNDNLDMCINAIRSALDINVDVTARGTSMCTGSMCTAEGEVEVGCATVPGVRRGAPWVLFGLLILGVGLRIRRRR